MKLSRQAWTAIRAMIVLTIVLGILYPGVIWLAGLAMPSQANGSLLRNPSGEVVGSSLIGQSFTDKKGNPLPQWFQSRPSAAGTGYDASASSGSNWGPENPDLIKAITSRQSQIEKLDGVTKAQIPADAVTASGSGLDPDISEAYALLQVPRVAQERGISESSLRALVEQHVEVRTLGYIGEPVVNVVELNQALSQLK
ncbi:potassium-transporting ATPase subunit KdpC [Pseudolysinimonas sp.]|uniref:potassium-transporting ATPase subunit KdpC n=1 Tax=Pseudolysinimonas sp. TaxID=2680009 RepID=UPI003F7E6169